jgi:sorbitol-specific phosphotransferase system component IIA
MEEEKKDAIKFAIDKPVEGTFDFGEFDTPMSGESMGKDGQPFTWHLYSFKDKAGDKQVFFPSKGLHKTLEGLAPINGRSFLITKVIMKDEQGNIKEDKMGKVMTTFDVLLNEAETPAVVSNDPPVPDSITNDTAETTADSL